MRFWAGIILLLGLLLPLSSQSQHYDLFSTAADMFHFHDAALKDYLKKFKQSNKQEQLPYVNTANLEKSVSHNDVLQADILNILIACSRDDSKQAISQVILLNENFTYDTANKSLAELYFFSKYLVHLKYYLYIGENDFLRETAGLCPKLKYLLYSEVFYRCDKLLKKIPSKIYSTYINIASDISQFDYIKACTYIIASNCGINTEILLHRRDSAIQTIFQPAKTLPKISRDIVYAINMNKNQQEKHFTYEKLVSLSDWGVFLRRKGNLKDSWQKYADAFKLIDDTTPQVLTSEIYSNAGITLSLQGKYENAAGLFEKALVGASGLQDKTMEDLYRILAARNTFNSGKNLQAIAEIQSAINTCLQNKDYLNLSESYLLLSEIYTDENDYLEAAKYYRLYTDNNKLIELNNQQLFQAQREQESRYEEMALDAFDEFQRNEAKKAETLKLKLEAAQREKDLLELRRVNELDAAKIAYTQLEKEKSMQNLALIEEKLRLKKKEIAALENQNRINVISNSFRLKELELAKNKNYLMLQKQLINEMRVSIIQKKQQSLKYGIAALTGLLLLVGFFLFRGISQRRKIEIQNIKLQFKNNEIAKQKDIIQEKNKEIIDSINYALKIQTAMLPTDGEMKSILGDVFVFYQPKAIVSGDFYWCFENSKYKYYATVDCTGHGVPGGFMSMLSISLLNEIVKEKKIEEPCDILDMLTARIIAELKQTEKANVAKDGMDITLCRLSKDKSELVVSGANNDLWILRKNELIEIKSNRQSIGFNYGKYKQFTQERITLQPKDKIYTFSDGYADQFGGNKKKKFKSRNLKNLLLAIYNHPAPEQMRLIKRTFEEWMGTEEQVDDVLIIGVLL